MCICKAGLGVFNDACIHTMHSRLVCIHNFNVFNRIQHVAYSRTTVFTCIISPAPGNECRACVNTTRSEYTVTYACEYVWMHHIVEWSSVRIPFECASLGIQLFMNARASECIWSWIPYATEYTLNASECLHSEMSLFNPIQFFTPFKCIPCIRSAYFHNVYSHHLVHTHAYSGWTRRIHANTSRTEYTHAEYFWILPNDPTQPMS